MTSKLRIKLGNLEVDYEGTDEFIKDEFPKLLATLKGLGTLNAAAQAAGPHSANNASQLGPAGDHTTNTIALKVGSNSGSDLVRAAAVRLGIVRSMAVFTRKELHAEMKSATSFYKKTYVNNLDGYLKTLVDNGTLLLQGDNTYALQASKKAELEIALVKP